MNRDKKIQALFIYCGIHHPEISVLQIKQMFHIIQKSHLEKYLRLFAEDQYYIIQTENMLTFEWEGVAHFTDTYQDFYPFDEMFLHAHKKYLEYLSHSEIAIIESTITTYSKFPVWQLHEWNHDEMFRTLANSKQYLYSAKEIEIARHFADDGLLDYLLKGDE